MFVVVFEVRPADGKRDEYLAHAKTLKPIIETIDGFIDNERFQSSRHPCRVLSLSTWRDEKSVIRWRVQSNHHDIQALSRAGVFADYQLRVCEITTDTHPPAGLSVIEHRFDATETGRAKALAITELSSATGDEELAGRLGLDHETAGLTEHEVYESIYKPGKLLLLTSWLSAEECREWQPNAVGEQRHRTARTIRQYGMFDRRETPQWFPPVPT